MRHRSPARWLAPLALVTCAVAVYAVAQQGASSSKGTGTPTTTSTTGTAGASTGTRNGKRKARTYIVKSGDNLSAIAVRTGATVADLQRLNPTVDSAALHPGQKLKLP